jgi:CubicO group peptidase (beta-lactamase class C family)
MCRGVQFLSAFLFAGLFTLLLDGCTASRVLVHNVPGIGDYRIFESRSVRHGDETRTFRIPSAETMHRMREILETPGAGGLSTADSLEQVGVVAFLVARGDTLLYERYFGGYTDSSWVASFSITKSFVSALVGIALAEGRLGGIDLPAADFIPELRERGLGGVTLRHLLRMTSGIAFSEGYRNPFSDAAVLYYGGDLRRIVAHCRPEEPPGRRFHYISVNTQILGEILERTTGVPLAEYLESRLWRPLGMEADASWSLDRRRQGMEKAFCCLNARARDFARFGLLYLEGGRRDGRQIVPEEWVRASTRPDPIGGGSAHYGYHWWLGDLVEGDYFAEGLHGQFIHVDPAYGTVMVMLSRKESEFGPTFFRRTARALERGEIQLSKSE